MVKGHLAISYYGPFSAEAQSWDPPHYDNSAAVSQCFSLCRLLSPWIQCLSTAPINWQSLPIYRRNQVSRWWSPEANETLGKSMALSHAVTTHSMSTALIGCRLYTINTLQSRGEGFTQPEINFQNLWIWIHWIQTVIGHGFQDIFVSEGVCSYCGYLAQACHKICCFNQ